MRYLRYSLIACSLVIATTANAQGTPAKPASPSSADLEAAKQLFFEGNDLYEANKYAEAQTKFKQSYRLSKNGRLLYYIAVTYDMQKNTRLALFYYKKFTASAPADAKNRKDAETRIRELTSDTTFDRELVRRQPKTPRASAKGFQHRVVEEAPPNMPLDLTALIPTDSKWQVSLYYRSENQRKYSVTTMKARYNELVGRIPAKTMKGGSVHYFIEAKDNAGSVVAASGKRSSPNLIFLDKEAKAQFYADVGTAPNSAIAQQTQALSSPRATPTPSSGSMYDYGSKSHRYKKWGSTFTAAGLFTIAVTSYFIANDARSALEGEAVLSNQEACATGAPCRVFSDHQRTLQSRGKNFTTIANISLGVGAAAAGVAAYYWIREWRAKKKKEPSPTAIAPAVGRDYIGGAASLRF